MDSVSQSAAKFVSYNHFYHFGDLELRNLL